MRLSEHFDRDEFRCHCNNCKQDTVDARLITVLESIRERFGQAVHVNSGNRCKYYNTRINGSKNSQHLLGKAADIIIGDQAPLGVYMVIDEMFPNELGLGRYNTFTHVDVREGKARWAG